MKPSPRILIVDDHEDIVTMLRVALTRHGFEIDSTTSPEEALARAETTPYGAALLDLVMPGQDGTELAAALREKIPGLPIGLMTAFARSPLIPAAQRAGVTLFTKPVAIQDLVDFLTSALA